MNRNMSFWDYVEDADQHLFLFLNGFHKDWLDPIMVLISDKWFWLPVYLLLLFLLFKKFDWKTGLWILLGVALSITLTDQISVHVFKEVVERYRPCHHSWIRTQAHVVDGCGGLYGFVSSHAANYFGVSTLLAFVFRKKMGFGLMIALWIWAALIAYSRIYLGVHYPLDAIGGALLGFGIGWGIYGLLRNQFPTRFRPDNDPTPSHRS